MSKEDKMKHNLHFNFFYFTNKKYYAFKAWGSFQRKFLKKNKISLKAFLYERGV